MMWFSKKISQNTDMPPFMRDSIQVNHLFHGVSDPTGGMLLSSASARGEHYYYQRWLWTNWCFIALRVASKGLTGAETSQPSSSPAPTVKNGVQEDDIATDNTVRETHTATASLPVSLQTKIDKMLSDDSETQQKTSTASAIPFSTSRFTKEVPRTSRMVSSDQKIRDAKALLDALAIEKSKRESRKRMVQADHKVAGAALISSRRQHETLTRTIAELQSRYEQVKALHVKADDIERSLTDVVAALDANDPANMRRHEQLEDEIAIKSQKLDDLKEESRENDDRINELREEALNVKSLITSTLQERMELEPVLTSLRDQAKELEERLKSALSKKFDSAAFTKRAQLVGKIAKRRAVAADRQKRLAAAASQSNVDVLVNHPMMKLIEVSGSKYPEEIVTKMHRDEEEAEILRARQESAELQLKDRRSRVGHLRNQIDELGLADSFSSSGHDSPSSDEEMEYTELLQHKQNLLLVVSNLTKSVKIAILNLHAKAQLLMHNDQTLSIHGVMNEGDSNIHADAKRVASSVNDLVKDICEDFSVLSNETPSKYQNVRVSIH